MILFRAPELRTSSIRTILNMNLRSSWSFFTRGRRKRAPAQFSKITDTEELIEEELEPDYDPKRFCTVTPGNVLGNGKYEILLKLG